MSRFSGDIERVLRAFGWHPGRAVADWQREVESKLGGEFVAFDAAREVLTEFGALVLDLEGPGESVALGRVSFDPLCALGESDRFDEFGKVAGERLYPLGEYDNGHFFIGIGMSGAIYCLMDSLQVVGGNIDEAVHAFVEGIAGREVE